VLDGAANGPLNEQFGAQGKHLRPNFRGFSDKKFALRE